MNTIYITSELKHKILNDISYDNKDFLFLIETIKKIFNENNFIIIKNLDLKIINFLIKNNIFFKTAYTQIKETSHISRDILDHSLKNLYYHCDGDIDLRFYNYGIIFILNNDYLNSTISTIVDINDFISLSFIKKEQMNVFFENVLPYYSKFKDNIIIKYLSPVKKTENGYIFQFRPRKIFDYYLAHNIQFDNNERELFEKFINVCTKLEKQIKLEKNDLFLFKNQKILHGRKNLSVALDLNNTIVSRKILVSFGY